MCTLASTFQNHRTKSQTFDDILVHVFYDYQYRQLYIDDIHQNKLASNFGDQIRPVTYAPLYD